MAIAADGRSDVAGVECAAGCGDVVWSFDVNVVAVVAVGDDGDDDAVADHVVVVVIAMIYLDCVRMCS